MPDLILNEELGLAMQKISNVDTNSPAASVLRIHAWVITAGDEALRDLGPDHNVDDFELIANVAEVTNTGYPATALDLTDTEVTITVDDTNNRVDVAFTDQTYTSISTGDNWSDITIAYDPDGTDTDLQNPVLFVFDFSVSPNGGDITVDFPAVSYRVTQA